MIVHASTMKCYYIIILLLRLLRIESFCFINFQLSLSYVNLPHTGFNLTEVAYSEPLNKLLLCQVYVLMNVVFNLYLHNRLLVLRYISKTCFRRSTSHALK